MSTETQKLIIRFGRQGHPLGRVIKAEEVPDLVESLRRRLGCTAEELDLSPESLKRLEGRLIALHQAVRKGQVVMDDEERVRLIREVAGYWGQVVAINLGGQWEERIPTLWPTIIKVPLPVETVKGEEVHYSSGRAFGAADNAAYFWDLIGSGEEKGMLWEEYEAMTKRRWREGL